MKSRLTNLRKLNEDDAERLAIEALSFIASDETRLSQFLQVTGFTLEAIRAEASSQNFLAGILDFLLSDDSLLLVFACHNGIDPSLVTKAKDVLTDGIKEARRT